MKGLFKSKPKTPIELVQLTRDLLIFFDSNAEIRERKREEKMSELSKAILEMRTVLFGNGQTEPNSEACSQLAQEFFNGDTLRLLIICLPKLDTGARQNATHVIANLQRQRVKGRVVAPEYLENNLDIMDILLHGYTDGEVALTYGAISRECIRHQTVARYVLGSEHMKKLFNYIQILNFDISSDAHATFKVKRSIPHLKMLNCQFQQELLTRHKSTVAEFLSVNYGWFFEDYNTQLLQSSNYITRRHAIKLLGEILLERSNFNIMIRYVNSLDNMRILMNLFRDSHRGIQLETFHVFKLFVANQNKPPEIVSVLVSNKSKLIRFIGDFNTDKEDEQFRADKAQVLREIANLDNEDRSFEDSEDCEVES